MSIEPGERRRRREAESAGALTAEASDDAVATSVSPAPAEGPPTPGPTTGRPLTRRELRERERRRAAAVGSSQPPRPRSAPLDVLPAQRTGPSSASTPPGAPTDVVVAPEPRENVTGADDADHAPDERDRYTAVHLLVLGVVLCVLGLLIWSLTTRHADEATAQPTPSSVLPATYRGDL